MRKEDSREEHRSAFAERFRLALKELGYSPNEQSRLQGLFGVSGQAVRKWVEGSAIPTSARMPQVAAILGVRRAWLQDGEEPMRPQLGVRDEPTPEGITLESDEVRLLLAYRSLPPEEKIAIATLLRALAALPAKR